MPDHSPDREAHLAAGALLEALMAALRERPELARHVATLARWALRNLETIQHEAADESISSLNDSEAPVAEAEGPRAPVIETRPVPAPVRAVVDRVIQLGGSKIHVSVPRADPTESLPVGAGAEWRPLPAVARPIVVAPAPPANPSLVLPPDPELIASRARLKAEACRWLLARRLQVGERVADLPAGLHAHLNSLLERGKALPHCFLWMVRPGHAVASDEACELAAAAFESMARAAELVHHALAQGEAAPPAPPAVPTTLLDIAAESQSALMNALRPMNREKDLDQQQMFIWLREYTQVHQVFIARHMRLDDPADPAAWPARRDRLELVAREVDERRELLRRRGQIIGHLRYQATRLAAAHNHDAAGAATSLIQHLQEWVDGRIPALDGELRSILLPVFDRLLDGGTCPPAVRRLVEAARGATGAPVVEGPTTGPTASRILAAPRPASPVHARDV